MGVIRLRRLPLQHGISLALSLSPRKLSCCRLPRRLRPECLHPSTTARNPGRQAAPNPALVQSWQRCQKILLKKSKYCGSLKKTDCSQNTCFYKWLLKLSGHLEQPYVKRVRLVISRYYNELPRLVISRYYNQLARFVIRTS